MKRRHSRGFTLLEMILVISTILFLLGVLIVVAANAHLEAQKRTTLSIIDAVESALERFYTTNGYYPDTREDPDTEKPGGTERRNLYIYLTDQRFGECLKASESMIRRELSGDFKGDPYLVDAWKNPVQVLIFEPDEDEKWGVNGGQPLVWSFGPDGRGWQLTDLRGLAAAQLVDRMYMKSDRTYNEDNLKNFRDIPLSFVK